MNLYLVQHAEALAEDIDPERRLSPKGREGVRKVGKFLKGKAAPTRIFHSGKLRAKETAEILSEYLCPECGTFQADGISPNDHPMGWAKELESLKEDVMVVGHLPHLARLANLLITGDDEPGIADFRMGGILCLRREAGRYAVSWMVVPELL